MMFFTHWVLLDSCRVLITIHNLIYIFLYYFCFGAANLVRLKFQILALMVQPLKPVVILSVAELPGV